MTRERLFGFAAAAVGAAAYGLNPLFSLPLYAQGFTPANVLFYRFALAAAIVGVIIRCRGGKLRAEPGELPALCVAGALMLGSSLTLYQAYRYMDTGIASTLLFIYPVVVATVMTLFFHEKLHWRTVAGIVLALAGVAALSKSGGGAVFSWKGLLLSLASAFSYSLFIVSVRVSVLRDSPADKIAFYAMLLSAAVCLFLSLAHNRLPLPRTAAAAGCILMLALLPTVAALVLTALAIHRIGATPASIFGALEPVVAVLCGIVVFHEKFTWNIAVGILLIFCSMLAAVLKPSR